MKDINFNNLTWKVLETEYGDLLSLNTENQHDQYEKLAYQDYIIDLLKTNDYGLFVDCGAFIGLYSLVASTHCEFVVSYEASSFLYGILLFNMRHCFNVFCKYAWVGLSDQIPTMKPNEYYMVTANRTEVYNIPVVELYNDIINIIISQPTGKKMLIKMDIEGNELYALKGARGLKDAYNIHWVIDVHVNVSPEEIMDMFPHRKIYTAENVIVIKGDKKDDDDPIFEKNWRKIE